MHWTQNYLVNRFQEYATDFENERETDLVPIETIDKVPIAMIVGEKDTTCTLERAEETKSILGDIVTSFEVLDD